MNMSALLSICDSGCSVVSIHAFEHTHSSIVKNTVRSKGQIMMQRFFYIVGGTIEFVLNDNRTVVAKKGSIVYLPPDITYRSTWHDSDDRAAISLQFDIACGGNNAILSDELTVIADDSCRIYYNLFLSLVNTYTEGRMGYKIKCQSIFLEILYSIIPDIIKTPGQNNTNPVNKGILYIENNYLNDIDVNQLAQMCSLSPSSFRSKFVKVTGMSPVKYKNYLKMKKAAELLKTGEYNAREAASAIGIDDEYYFNKMFKSFFGVTPGKFKAV